MAAYQFLPDVRYEELPYVKQEYDIIQSYILLWKKVGTFLKILVARMSSERKLRPIK